MDRVLVHYNRRETSAEARAFLNYLAGSHVKAGVTFGADLVLDFGADPRGILWQPFESFAGVVFVVGSLGLDEDDAAGRKALHQAREKSLPVFLVLAKDAPLPVELNDLPPIPAGILDEHEPSPEEVAIFMELRALLFQTDEVALDFFLAAPEDTRENGETIRIESAAEAPVEMEAGSAGEEAIILGEEELSNVVADIDAGGDDLADEEFTVDDLGGLGDFGEEAAFEELAPLEAEAGGSMDLDDIDEEGPVPMSEDDYGLGGLSPASGGLAGGGPAGGGPAPAAEDYGLGDLGELDDLRGAGPPDAGDHPASGEEGSGDESGGDDAGGAVLRQDEIDSYLLSGSDVSLSSDDYSAISGAGMDSIALDPAGAPPEPVQFEAYFPPAAHAGGRYVLVVYARIDDDAVAREVATDVERFRDQLGGETPRPRRARKAALLKVGTRLTVVPECEEIEFEPGRVEKRWQGDWTRFAFDFRPGETAAGETALCRVSIQVAGIEIAHINCAFEILPEPATLDDQERAEPEPMKMGLAPASFAPEPENPLARARVRMQLESRAATPYQNIFISYSRRDYEVTRAYREAQLALGNTVFYDTESIRAGQNWRAALAAAIDGADVFQLFWSKHSARSENVRDEWGYALTHRCPDESCAGFIRPVYWKKPPPAPPEELAHLHFKFVPLG